MQKDHHLSICIACDTRLDVASETGLNANLHRVEGYESCIQLCCRFCEYVSRQNRKRYELKHNLGLPVHRPLRRDQEAAPYPTTVTGYARVGEARGLRLLLCTFEKRNNAETATLRSYQGSSPVSLVLSEDKFE